MVGTETSLRERSKAKRRDAIQRAAFRLFAEFGYDGATLADIAGAAEVAPRTVSLYFPSKLDIAMSSASEVASRLTATFQSHPDLAYTEVIDRWLVNEAKMMDTELAALTTAMFDVNPQLRAISHAYLAESTQLSQRGLLAQLNIDADDPLVPIAGAAVDAAITQYLTTLQTSGMETNQHHAFMRYLRAIIKAAGIAPSRPS